MTSRPHANKFTSTEAILGVLERLEERGTVTVLQVMGDVPCCEKQARDYLAFLEGRGLIERERRGRTDEFRKVAPPGPHTGTVTLAEATGTEFAVAVIGALRGTAFHEAAVDHIKRLRGDLRKSEGPRAARLRSAFYTVRGSVPGNKDHAVHAEEVLDALTHGNQIKATYELVSTGEVKEYVLNPIGIVVHHHEGLHLVARRADSGKMRMFDVEGFHAVERIRGSTAPPPDVAMDTYFEDSFGRYADFPVHRVVLRLGGEAARQVKRRSFHKSQKIESEDGDEVVVAYRVGVCPEFTAWVLGLDPAAEVLEPQELRDTVRRRGRDAAKANAAHMPK